MGAAVLLSQRRAAEAAQRAANSRLELRAAEQTQSVTAAKSRLTQQLVEQQQIEAALRESRQRCELDAEGADGGVWEWDVETRSAYFSPRWKGRLACRESGIEPTMAAWESRLHPDDRARALAAVAVFREGGASQFRLEHRLRHQDGSYRWISLGSGLCDEQGRIVRMRASIWMSRRDNRLRRLGARAKSGIASWSSRSAISSIGLMQPVGVPIAIPPRCGSSGTFLKSCWYATIWKLSCRHVACKLSGFMGGSLSEKCPELCMKCRLPRRTGATCGWDNMRNS